MSRRLVTIVSAGSLAAALALPVVNAATASALPGQTFVSPSAAANNSDTSCSHASYTSIKDAISAVAPGGTVVVCAGTYPSVTIKKRITLLGKGATIDATGAPYGIGITAPYVTVRGFTVTGADNFDAGPADGIITAGFTTHGLKTADYATIEDNTVSGNLGSGIDLNSTSYSVARHNVANGNGVGINVADDLGPASTHNTITHNVTNENFGGCGIALADHTGAGVNDNVITYNESNDNGLSTPTAPDASAGSGIILASPVPGGTVRNNLIAQNSFEGNGHGGVVVHSHVPNIPNGPTNDFSGNVIKANDIGTNNLRTDSHDLETTGIYLGSASPLTITVQNNVIHDDAIGIFTAGDVTLVGGPNHFTNVPVHVSGVAAY